MDERTGRERRCDLWLLAFLACSTAVATARSRHPSGDWSFFVEAAPSITTRRALLIYADFPHIQTGPLTIVVARVLDPLGYVGFRVAVTLTCMAIMLVLVRSSRGVPLARTRLAIGGLVLTQLWPSLSRFGHLDDALVLLLACCCTAAARSDRKWVVAVLAGTAVAIKPWSLFLLALNLPRRNARSTASAGPMLASVAIAAVIWAPFVLATPKTIAGLRPTVLVASDSVLALFGQTHSSHVTAFRITQLLAVLGLSVLVQRRCGPSGVLWVGVAARLLLDPATWPYYTVGFVLGALVWDVYERRGRMPWATLGSVVLLAPSWLVSDATVRGALRLLACVAALVVVLGSARRSAGAELRACTPSAPGIGSVA